MEGLLAKQKKDAAKEKAAKIAARAEEMGMDLSGFRLGKTRLVAKKKKKSALKKVILSEREQEAPPLPDVQLLLSTLSPDAPEFVPEFVPAPVAEVRAASRGRSSSRCRKWALDAPVFVPSWCREAAAPGGDDAPAAESLFADSSGLAISEVLERMEEKHHAAQRQAKELQKKPGKNIEVRHYVHQVLSDELDEKVKTLLGLVMKFQEKAKENPMRYQKQKRFCVGMREAMRAVTRGKAKCLILAPNLELSSEEGGLDNCVEELMEKCCELGVPLVFALSRNRIGKALGRNIRLSVVCVINKEGAHKEVVEIVQMTNELRRQWVLQTMGQAALSSGLVDFGAIPTPQATDGEEDDEGSLSPAG